MATSSLPAASTFSKDPRLFGVDFQPDHIDYGLGATVYCDDQPYVDWISALGSLLLGHAHPEFCEQVAAQIERGTNYSLVSRLEGQVAERLTALLGTHVPGWRPDGLGVRFVLSGSDACTAAVRLARAVTRRQWVLSVGYHGWHDWAVSTTPPHYGVTLPQYVRAVPFGDLEALAANLDYLRPVACVIVEQLPEEPPPGYWEGVRKLCSEHGALLLVDEVVTGFRLALGGACELYGIEPDICTYAKAISNGVPFGAVVGLRSLFNAFDLPTPVFVSGTSLGSPIGLAACDAVLDIWTQAGVDHIRAIGGALQTGLVEAGYRVVGQPTRFIVQHETPARHGYFVREMARRHVLFNRPTLACLAHTLADVALTVKAATEVRKLMLDTDVEGEMRGKLPAQLFANR